jgi:hypothetical protein
MSHSVLPTPVNGMSGPYGMVAMAILVCGHVIPPAVWAWARRDRRSFVGLERLRLVMSSLEVIAAMMVLVRLTAAVVYLRHGLACEPPDQ